MTTAAMNSSGKQPLRRYRNDDLMIDWLHEKLIGDDRLHEKLIGDDTTLLPDK